MENPPRDRLPCGMTLDAQVLELLTRDRRDEAATRVLEALGPEVLGYLRAVLRDPAEAGDAFSHFAESVWRGLPGFRGESSLRTWCYGIAWRCVMSVRRDPRVRLCERLGSTLASQLAGRIFATTAFERERQASALERLRARLDPEEQTLLTLRIDRQLSWAEVADVLAGAAARPDEAALRKRFERLKYKLATAARDEGLVP
jgi:RNA polymerase sigma-70 factor (ECF subfamily)